MFDSLIANIVTGVARHLITGLGVYLASQGYLDSSQQDAWLGSLMFLVGVGLSAFDKHKASTKLTAAKG